MSDFLHSEATRCSCCKLLPRDLEDWEAVAKFERSGRQTAEAMALYGAQRQPVWKHNGLHANSSLIKLQLWGTCFSSTCGALLTSSPSKRSSG
jgi:hypothetical protein